MSGASITTNTIPKSAIVGISAFNGIVDTDSTQTITGNKTFDNMPLFKSGIVSQANCAFANGSIQPSAISGGVGASLSSANTRNTNIYKTTSHERCKYNVRFYTDNCDQWWY